MTDRTLRLYAVTTGLAALEAGILQSLSFQSALPLAPQITAPAPLAAFHDLRWVWTFASSPWSTVWMLASLIAFRAVTDAVIIRLAWPAGHTPPAVTTVLRRSALFTVLAVVVMSPWATLTFMGAVTGLSQLLLGAILGSGLTALLLPPGIVTGEWWRRILPLRSMGWVLLGWLGATVAALAITYSPSWVTVLAAAGGGLVNGWIWQRIVATVVAAGAPRWTVPGVPVVALAVSTALLVLGGYVFSGTVDVWGGSSSASPARAAARAGATGTGPPVVYVGGFDSTYGGGPIHLLPPGFREVNFSYRGLDGAGRPLPYTARDTHQSLAVSAQRLGAQVEAVHRRTGGPVGIVAQSEGTVVTERYLADTPRPPVVTYVALSPLVRAGRVYYPTAGERGYGYLAGWEARGITGLFHLESARTDLRPDMPFLRSLVDQAPLYRNRPACPVPGVHTYFLLPLEAALTVYRGPITHVAWGTFPGWHASLLSDAHTQRVVARPWRASRTTTPAGGCRSCSSVARPAPGSPRPCRWRRGRAGGPARGRTPRSGRWTAGRPSSAEARAAPIAATRRDRRLG